MKIGNDQRGILPVLLIALGAILVGGTATGVASNSARPGDLLYGVDQALESVQASLTFGDEAKANMYTKLAQERLGELKSLVNGNASADKLDQAARNYSDEIGNVLGSIDKIGDGAKVEELSAKLAEDTMLQKDEVLGLMDGAGDQAKNAMQNAVHASDQTFEKSMNKLSEQKRNEVQNRIQQQVKNMGEEDMLKINQSTGSGEGSGSDGASGNPDSGSGTSGSDQSSSGQPVDTGSSGSSSSGRN